MLIKEKEKGSTGATAMNLLPLLRSVLLWYTNVLWAERNYLRVLTSHCAAGKKRFVVSALLVLLYYVKRSMFNVGSHIGFVAMPVSVRAARRSAGHEDGAALLRYETPGGLSWRT